MIVHLAGLLLPETAEIALLTAQFLVTTTLVGHTLDTPQALTNPQ